MFEPTEIVDAADEHRIPAGTAIGSYVIEALIAEGGMGAVYSATHSVLMRRAAVKILRPEMVALPSARDGLLKEAQILDALSHPAVTQLYDAGILPDGRPWIAMELLAGECLGDRLHAKKRLPHEEVTQIVDSLTEVLMAAHARGYVHRDIKPENVMLVESEQGLVTRVIDWGIASSMSEDAESEIAAGTPHYMAPEQVRGDRGDARTDVYSLGAVAFEMLSGRTPFVGDSALEVAMQQISRPVPDIEVWVDRLPSGWSALLKGMLAKNPEDRPDLAQVRSTLRSIAAGPMPPTVEVSFDAEGPDGYYESLTTSSLAASFLGDCAAQNVVRTRWTPAAPATPLSARPTQKFPKIVSSSVAPSVAGTIDDAPAGKSAPPTYAS